MKRIYSIITLLLFALLAVGQTVRPSLIYSDNPNMLEVSAEGGQFTYRYRVFEANPDNIQSELEDYLRSKGCLWLTVEDIIPDSSDVLAGNILFKAESNHTGATRQCMMRSALPIRIYLISQPSSVAPPTVFPLSCPRYLLPGSACMLTLAGSEPGVTYRLYLDGSLVENRQGTGSPLEFQITQPGLYRLEGIGTEGTTSRMGEALVDWLDVNNYNRNRNYVLEKTYTSASSVSDSSLCVRDITYTDGFGRSLQTIQIGASGSGTGDIILPYKYGAGGRAEMAYLPYAKADNWGAFIPNAYVSDNWVSIYGSADAPYTYAETKYDGSPLNRVVRQTGAGKNWHISAKGVSTEYTPNVADEVRRYKADVFTGALSLDGFYQAGSLEKVITTDEDGHRVETFTDNVGKTVLTVTVDDEEEVKALSSSAGKGMDGNTEHAAGDTASPSVDREQTGTISPTASVTSRRLETYYVYDDRDRLRWVLSPEASHRLGNTVNPDILQELAYYYAYDRLGRMTEKHLPGCEPVYMVYDKRDRLVLSQDGNQRAANGNKWSYSVYDKYNHIVESGETVLATSATHKQLQDGAWDAENYLPEGVKTPLQYTVYGSYEATEHVTTHPFTAVDGYASEYHSLVTGLVTSTKTRVLGTDTWLTATTYYDGKCRPIQTVSDNQHGGLSTVNTVYDFVGNVLKQRETHGMPGTQASGSVDGQTAMGSTNGPVSTVSADGLTATGTTDVLETVYTYDDRNRLLSATYTLNSGTSSPGGTTATVTYEYDEVGRLVKKHYSDNVTEELQYNIRGWLTSKESEAFKMQLHYEVPEAGGTACYNGNISEWSWKQGTNVEQLYGFAYDGASRLKETAHKQKSGNTWVAHTNAYEEKGLTYDRNGNIQTLQRTGNGTLVDNLAYMYAGNQLTNNTYDANGNKTSVGGLSYTYNLLGLQDKVYQTSGHVLKAQYDYLANGVKLGLRDGHGDNGYDYDGKFIYSLRNGALSLEIVTFADGQFTENGVRYALRDHLRNVRALVNANGTILEQNDYYPFGGAYTQPGYLQAGNRHLLNGKESQLLTDAGIYDFGFRMYDSHTGSWNAVDRICEKYYSNTPYMYANNNPLRYIDLWGLDTLPIVGDDLYGGELPEVVVTAKRFPRYYLYLSAFPEKKDETGYREDISHLINGLDWSFSILNASKETKWFREYTQRMSNMYNHRINQIDGKYVWVKNTADGIAKSTKWMVKNSKKIGRYISGASVADALQRHIENLNIETGMNVGVATVGAVSFFGAICTLEYSILWNGIKDYVESWYYQGERFMRDLTTFKINPIRLGY